MGRTKPLSRLWLCPERFRVASVRHTSRGDYHRVIFTKMAHMVQFGTFYGHEPGAAASPRAPHWPPKRLAVGTRACRPAREDLTGPLRPRLPIARTGSFRGKVEKRGAPRRGGERGAHTRAGPGGVGRLVLYRKAYPLSRCTYTMDGDAKRYPLSLN